MPMELILNKKRYASSSRVFDLKKSVLKLLDRTVYINLSCLPTKQYKL
jgi:hypothetical protein